MPDVGLHRDRLHPHAVLVKGFRHLGGARPNPKSPNPQIPKSPNPSCHEAEPIDRLDAVREPDSLELRRSESDAEQLLSAWSAPWHPVLLAAAESIPQWAAAAAPPEPSDFLAIVPECCEPRLPPNWTTEAEAAGAVCAGLKNRQEMLAAAIAVVRGEGTFPSAIGPHPSPLPEGERTFPAAIGPHPSPLPEGDGTLSSATGPHPSPPPEGDGTLSSATGPHPSPPPEGDGTLSSATGPHPSPLPKGEGTFHRQSALTLALSQRERGHYHRRPALTLALSQGRGDNSAGRRLPGVGLLSPAGRAD